MASGQSSPSRRSARVSTSAVRKPTSGAQRRSARATGVARAILRPDLYESRDQRDEVETARAQEYALLAALLTRAPDAALLRRIAGLGGDATSLGRAHAALAQAAGAASRDHIEPYFHPEWWATGLHICGWCGRMFATTPLKVVRRNWSSMV